MNCVTYERGLNELIEAGLSSSERSALVEELAGHARSCESCRGSAALVELLALPSGSRELADEPEEGYWRGFDEGLRRRLSAERRSAPPRAVPWIAAAAAVLLAALGIALLRAPLSESARTTRTDATRAAAEVDPPRELLELLRRSDPAGAMEGLDFLGGLGGLVDPAEENGLEVEAWNGSNESDGWLFPDVDSIEPEAREALLEWLEERTPANQGVRS